ncbi:hypothetical protein PSTT_13717 [Puccinia striiformis]|uniref:GH16 domain-containing protein n=2 Tax=Puccinia striiformis TaxID=27350 RepID=A0A2S4UQK6_9BASI|nr:hypothetical protein PSTT_13717 [Puccinia striiformis]
MFSLTTHSRSAGLASTMIWLGLTIALLSSLTPVLAGHDGTDTVPNPLARRKLSNGSPGPVNAGRVPQTSVWSHYDTISGFNFFDSFTFINRWDNTTHSAAYYVSKAEAQKLSLAYVDQNARAIIAVDTTKDISADVMPAVFLNTTTGTFKYNRTALRSSVRLESLERYDAGTMVIADFQHTPYGCASWPAFWMHGEDWPNGGEIDIFEGWNDNTHGRAVLHTSPGCGHDPTGIQTGKLLQETCDSKINWNQLKSLGFLNPPAGCAAEDPTTDFYGPPLNKNGGAVFATMYTTSEISVWRWRRQDVPEDIKSSSPRPESWPTPVGTWKNGASCDIDKHFGPQNLVINIALCGDSDLNTYSEGKCPGKCYDHLLKGSNYKDVYFSINSIKIFKGTPDAVSKVHATVASPKPVVPPSVSKPAESLSHAKPVVAPSATKPVEPISHTKPVAPTDPNSHKPIPVKEL